MKHLAIRCALCGLVSALAIGFPRGATAAIFTLPRVKALGPEATGSSWQGQGLHLAVMSRIGHVGVRNEPSGEVELRLGWSEGGLHSSIDVADAERFESGTSSLYRADSVELFVAPEAGSSDYMQVIAAPGIEGSESETPRWVVVGYGDLKHTELQAEVRGGPTSNGYALAIHIPWESLGIEPEEGRRIGAQVFVNDRDVERARIGDYTLSNSQMDHICWFPDRTTAFDQTRMHTLVLGDATPEVIMTLNDLDLGAGRLRVFAPPRFAGRLLEVFQGSTRLGHASLLPDEARHLARGTVTLDGLQPDAEVLSLRVEGLSLDTLRLYARPDGREAACLAALVRADEEKRRLDLMRELHAATRDELLLADLQTLLPLVEVWAEGRAMAESMRLADPNAYLSSTVNPMSPEAVRRDSPLFPVYALYRARNLIWRAIQGGYADEVEAYYSLARHLLREAQNDVPDSPLVNMYLGEPLPWPGTAPDPNAPAWANAQRAALEKLVEIVHWWIDERQMSNGSYGGGWNDDVEMWRNWWPVLFAFEDDKAAEAQRLLSTSMFAQPHMAHGFSSVMDDVEHSAEDSADTITPMLYLASEDPVWARRALNIARLTREVWTGRNDAGDLMFKNIVFNSQATRNDPNNAYDTTLDTRAIQPAFVYWQMTRDPNLARLFTDWLDTWVEVAASDRNGKPAGVLPTAIHYPDGRIGGLNRWWDAEAFSTLYNWPRYVKDMLHTLMMASFITGRDAYMGPVHSMAALRIDFLERHPAEARTTEMALTGFGLRGKPAEEEPAEGWRPGSRDWCAAQMGPLLPGPLSCYRRLSGDRQYDEVILRDGDGYMRFLVDGDRAGLEQDLAEVAAAFSFNRPAYTDEVRWTDRVFRFTSGYLNNFTPRPLPLPNTRTLYATLTGDVSTWAGCRFAAVRWRTTPSQIAALVTGCSTEAFAAELYHFGDEPRPMQAELPLLEAGRYVMELRAVDGRDLSREQVTVGDRDKTIRFSLPPGTLCSLVMTPA